MDLTKINAISVDDQYKKFPDTKKNDILKLLEWIKQQPHLPQISELETFFFLHSCYNSTEAAKQTIDTFYTIRTHSPEFFSNRDILGEDMLHISKIIAVAPLQKLTPEGYKVSLAKLVETDPSRYIFADTLKLICFFFDIMMMQQGTAEGYVLVIDMQGTVLGHVARLGLLVMKKFLIYLQEGSPIRLKAIHFINVVPLIDKVLALMRPFLKKELLDSIHLHKSMESFYEFIPKDMLPMNYGGPEESVEIQHNNYFEKLKGYGDFFKQEEQFRRVNEKLRPGKPKAASDVFGAEGNFKKLDID